jgi:hypothetical protein
MVAMIASTISVLHHQLQEAPQKRGQEKGKSGK